MKKQLAKKQGKAAPNGPMVYTVPLELGGRELTLEFNYKAYMAMFEYSGIDLLGLWDTGKFSSKDIASFLLSGTLTHHPDLEFDWVITQLNGRNTVKVLSALLDALRRSMPDPEPDPETAANPPRPVM
jgi:hypothetical protein